MEEARSSWNTMYRSKEGFDCQITLRDEDEANLAERSNRVMVSIAKSGGVPLVRRGYSPGESSGRGNEESNEGRASDKPPKTYLDREGVRRCNLTLVDGTVCGYPVTRREGRYGPFWGCPNYKEHER